VVVRGRVQGVWYRRSCRDQAVAAGVAGWVRNNPDGTVEAVLEGDDDAIASVLAWMRQGPPGAEVAGVEVTSEAVRGEQGFAVR
jgi:acylphosphatase